MILGIRTFSEARECDEAGRVAGRSSAGTASALPARPPPKLLHLVEAPRRKCSGGGLFRTAYGHRTAEHRLALTLYGHCLLHVGCNLISIYDLRFICFFKNDHKGLKKIFKL